MIKKISVICFLVIAVSFNCCKKQNEKIENTEEMAAPGLHKLDERILGSWRLESANGKHFDTVSNIYVYFETGKAFHLANPIEDDGVQISDEYAMDWNIFDYSFDGETILFSGNPAGKVTFENDAKHIVETTKGETLVLIKNEKSPLHGNWIRHFDRNHVFKNIVKENLTGISIDDFGEESEFTIELGKTISHINAKRYDYDFDLNFDGKMVFANGRTLYFIFDGDRMLFLINIEDVLIPVIYQKQR